MLFKFDREREEDEINGYTICTTEKGVTVKVSRDYKGPWGALGMGVGENGMYGYYHLVLIKGNTKIGDATVYDPYEAKNRELQELEWKASEEAKAKGEPPSIYAHVNRHTVDYREKARCEISVLGSTRHEITLGNPSSTYLPYPRAVAERFGPELSKVIDGLINSEKE